MMKIVVLAGGDSSEREVSLNSSRAVATALEQTGHTIQLIDTLDGSSLLADECSTPETKEITTARTSLPSHIRDADCVFIGLHGGTGENGKVQALLELCNVPYTGSGVMASALAMDKQRTKLIVSTQGVPTVPTLFFGKKETVSKSLSDSKATLEYPIVVKPNTEGSTVGLTIVEKPDRLNEAVELAAKYDCYILIEAYIPGRELTVGLLDGEALPVVEIIPKSGFYDYHAKYTAGASDYVCPAEISQRIEDEIRRLAEISYRVIGCEGYARADFRMNSDGQLFFLEMNTLPGMTSTSLVPKAARAAGIEFPELVERIVKLCTARFQKRGS